MGYLITGFAFGTQPQWQRLGGLFPTFPGRGYKHRRASLFLWDVWKPNPRDTREHFPFSAGPIVPRDVQAPHSVPSTPVSDAFDRVCRRLEQNAGYPVYPAGWLGIPLLVAATAGVPTYSFTADDESLDFAAFVDSGAIQTAGCRHHAFELIVERNALSVKPLVNEEDDEELDEELLASLVRMEGIKLLDTTHIQGGSRIHDHPARLWPKGWGDPEQLLGLGTWDPFETFTEDFELVFETKPVNRPWWKFWN